VSVQRSPEAGARYAGEHSGPARSAASALSGLALAIVAALTLWLASALAIREGGWVATGRPSETATVAIRSAPSNSLPRAAWPTSPALSSPTAPATPSTVGLTVDTQPESTAFSPPAKPTSTPAPRCTHPGGWVRYVVRPGDTLWSLAVRYGMTVDRLRRANCLQGNTIYAGQVLWVPYYLRPTATRRPPALTRIPPTATRRAPTATRVVPTATKKPRPTRKPSAPTRRPTHTPKP
jgi:hypothetical protein